MKWLIQPARLTADIPIGSERVAILIAAADAIGSFVRISGDFPRLPAFRRVLLQLRQSGHTFESVEEEFYPGLLVAACYSEGRTVFRGIPARFERLERALRALGAPVKREGQMVTVSGSGSLAGGIADAEEDEEAAAYIAVAATMAERDTIIENAAGDWLNIAIAAGGRGTVL